MADENSLPKAVTDELSALSVKLKRQASGYLVWQQVLLPAEREKMSLADFLQRHCVDQFVRLRRVSHTRAVLDIAVGIDLLTANRYTRLLRDIGEVDGHQMDKPNWNGDRCELSFRGRVVRKIRSRNVGANVCQILDVFQEDGWPDRIDDPLTDGPNAQRLRETVRTLNAGLTDLKFRMDGTGEGVLWEID